MKVVVYSCVTGGHDKVSQTVLKSCGLPDNQTDFVLFSDRPDLVASGAGQTFRLPGGHLTWQILPVIYQHPTSDTRTARWHKINSHLSVPDYDASIWIDGSQRIKAVNLRTELAEPYFASPESQTQPIAAFRHPDRACVYQEAAACMSLEKDSPDTLRRQAQSYQDEGYPLNNGLVETACVLRRNSPAVVRFNTLWWQQVENFSRRDQVSFNYVAWKTGIDYGRIEGQRDESRFFDFVPHKKT